MYILPWLSTNDRYGGDEFLDLAAAFLMGDPPRAFGSAIKEFELYAQADTKTSPSGVSMCSQRDRRKFLATLPRVQFLRRHLRIQIHFVTQLDFESHTVEYEGEGKVKEKRIAQSVASFRAACQEMASNIRLAEAKLKKSDDFDWKAFSAHLDRRLAQLPKSRAEFHRLSKKLVSPWERIRDSQPVETEPSARALKKRPKLITINHDDDCASHIGRTADGRQFFLTTPFIPAQREFIALYLFDANGKFLKAYMDDLGKREELDPKRGKEAFERRFAQLGPVKLGRIRVEPFKIKRFGTEFGLIPVLLEDEEDEWTVEAQPGNYMAFLSLGAAATTTPDGVPALTKMVGDTGLGPQTNNFLFLRARAAFALGKIGPAASSALPTLKAALLEWRPDLRGASAVAIWRISADVDTALPVLLREMPGTNDLSKSDWIIALGEMGPRAKEAVPQLRTELQENREDLVLKCVTNALKSIDPEAAAAAGVK